MSRRGYTRLASKRIRGRSPRFFDFLVAQVTAVAKAFPPGTRVRHDGADYVVVSHDRDDPRNVLGCVWCRRCGESGEGQQINVTQLTVVS